MLRVDVDPVAPSPEVIAHAARLLRSGRLVAFPTETVYGLGANAIDASAVERIFAAKGRPSYNPLIVHVVDAAAARHLVRAWPDQADALIAAFWPGPLTLVMPKRPVVPDAVTAGLPSVAVRMPAHPVARALLAAAEIPIAAPSANRSMLLSPTTGEHVERSLGAAVDLILDAGPTAVGIESTVLDLSGDQPTLLRPGTIMVQDIEAVIGSIANLDRGRRAGESVPRKSPGMLDRHYAPRARLLLASGDDLPAIVRGEATTARSVGAMVIDATVEAENVTRMPRDPLAYASKLYGVLHTLDDVGCDVIVVERVPDDAAWLAVRDRLARASS
jgi:L-threonylcarbamoyladenylate synthase